MKHETPATPIGTPVTGPDDEPQLDIRRQTKYFLRCLKTYLPQPYTSNDSNRMSLAFFIICALDLLGSLKENTTPDERQGYIDWIYRNQHPRGGFRAFPGTDVGDHTTPDNERWDPANLPSTYFALCLLLILEDDLSRANRKDILRWLPTLQRPDGSFGETLVGDSIEGGQDSRFGYCAVGVRYIMGGDVSRGHEDIDVDKLVRCICLAECYDGGISDAPFHEAHAGFTFCGIAALSFIDRLPPSLSGKANGSDATPSKITGVTNLRGTLHWLASRQTATITEEDDFDTNGDETDTTATCHDAPSFINPKNMSDTGASSYGSRPSSHFELQWTGYNGRCNKVADTCYAFWVGGAMAILGQPELPPQRSVRRWLLENTAHKALGGFGKHAGDLPDVFHGCLGLAALSLMGVEGLKPLDATMCISQEAKGRLDKLRAKWSAEDSFSSTNGA